MAVIDEMPALDIVGRARCRGEDNVALAWRATALEITTYAHNGTGLPELAE